VLTRRPRGCAPARGAPAQELSYTVPSNTVKGEVAHLLHGVSGFFEPSQMTALVRHTRRLRKLQRRRRECATRAQPAGSRPHRLA
jgi:hypothetical protein